MKVIIFVCVIIIFVISAFYDDFFYSNNQMPTNYNKANSQEISYSDLPSFEFTNLDNQKLKIESFRGKVVLLNFWASWCGPCLEEFPYMMRLLKLNKNLVLIAISNDQKIQDINKFIKGFRKNYADLIDSEQVIFARDPDREISVRKFNVLKLPETFIINSNQKIVRKVVGAQEWKEKELEVFLGKLHQSQLKF